MVEIDNHTHDSHSVKKTFDSLASTAKKKQSRREKLLAEIEPVVPWKALLTLIEEHQRKSGKAGRPRVLGMLCPLDGRAYAGSLAGGHMRFRDSMRRYVNLLKCSHFAGSRRTR